MTRFLTIGFLAVMAMSSPAAAQRIGFGLSAGSEGITLTNMAGVTGGLDFNQVKPVITPGSQQIRITLSENTEFMVPIKIEAPEHLDITVDVTAPTVLSLLGSQQQTPPTQPFQVGWAYWNLSSAGPEPNPYSPLVTGSAREVQTAVGLPLPFTSATFPMRRRADGSTPPPPPPTPPHGGYVPPPLAVAYVLVYGSFGPVSTDASSGTYTGTIEITVQFASYD